MLRLIGPIAAGLMAALLIGASAVSEPMELRSDGGHFVLSVTGIDRPEPVNRMHGVDLSLATVGGEPVSGAKIVLTGNRQFTPNPLPTLPQVTPAAGDGHYRVEGLRFHMPGEWHLFFDIKSAQTHERATLTVEVR